jgi:hypothetical protein
MMQKKSTVAMPQDMNCHVAVGAGALPQRVRTDACARAPRTRGFGTATTTTTTVFSIVAVHVLVLPDVFGERAPMATRSWRSTHRFGAVSRTQ